MENGTSNTSNIEMTINTIDEDILLDKPSETDIGIYEEENGIANLG